MLAVLLSLMCYVLASFEQAELAVCAANDDSVGPADDPGGVNVL